MSCIIEHNIDHEPFIVNLVHIAIRIWAREVSEPKKTTFGMNAYTLFRRPALEEVGAV